MTETEQLVYDQGYFEGRMSVLAQMTDLLKQAIRDGKTLDGLSQAFIRLAYQTTLQDTAQRLAEHVRTLA